MRVLYGLDEYQPPQNGSSIALGFFDGVHLGHRAVIGGCVRDRGALKSVVLTFAQSPAKALGRPAPPLLSSNGRKAELIGALGADELIFADFAAVKDMSPEKFVEEILYERLNAKRVTCGFNYRFGKGGAGDTAALEALCGARGIKVCVTQPVYCGKEQVSSSLIRARIAAGEIERANEMLGYRYAIGGEIGGGNHIGTMMGFPTVNIPIGDGLTVPRCGVYASDITIGGVRYKGATDIGVHPTVGENEKPLCETFLLDFAGGDLYGKKAVCELTSFVREERRFGSKEELAAQIKKDCEMISKLNR
ncbi:MAG: riboflavin biosynthesis protein RibF [Ruminococcus sp.]|nr:riboflavin biosynthesis protein RibF [Ruminococcus sp.]